jgi:cytochrome c oxidase subunit II
MPAQRARFRPLAATAPLLGAALSACSGDLSTLDPAGPAARAIATLWWIMLAGATVIFAAVSGVLVLAWRRPGALGDDPPRRLILWGGLVMPSAVLAALVAAAFVLGERLVARSDGAAPLVIEAEASRWAWTFTYPEAGGRATAGVLHLPAGRDVTFVVTSADVIHSFWIPRLGGKIDAIPGHPNRITLRADRPGTYGGVCAEYCGEGHAAMRFTVEAHDPADYAAVLDREATP